MGIDYFETPIGFFCVKSSDKGLTNLTKVDFPEKCNPSEFTNDCVIQVLEYFQKKRTKFDLPLDLSAGTPFNQSVWEIVKDIPFGRTLSYSKIAKELENPNAVRAVGAANKYNPLAIIIPCHRVIGKNGDLTGYFYGLDVKRKLLEHENPLEYGTQQSLF